MLTAEQVAEWQEFYSREPFGFAAEDHRNALLAFTVARSAGNKRARIDDFLLGPKLEQSATAGKPEDPETLKERLRAAFGLHRPKK